MKSLSPSRGPAFTLVELVVVCAILVVMMGFLISVLDQTARVMRSTTGKVEQFREARAGFERMTTRLSQAVLNTYWDYDNATTPTRYERRSELRFLSGDSRTLLGDNGAARRLGHCVFFNVPLGVTETDTYRGLGNGLNSVGYFLEFADDSKARPSFITAAMSPLKWRWRLMEFSQTTETFGMYKFTSGLDALGKPRSSQYKTSDSNGKDWFLTGVNGATPTTRVAVNNVVALIITPRLSKIEEAPYLAGNPDYSPLAPNYSYDTTLGNLDPRLDPKSQLPPVVQVTMVALDERSAEKLQLDSSKWDLLGVSSKFTSTVNFTTDLSIDSAKPDSIEKTLVRLKAQYRIFTTNVHIRGAKWSREQKDN